LRDGIPSKPTSHNGLSPNISEETRYFDKNKEGEAEAGYIFASLDSDAKPEEAERRRGEAIEKK